jgi:hypothetical protein
VSKTSYRGDTPETQIPLISDSIIILDGDIDGDPLNPPRDGKHINKINLVA